MLGLFELNRPFYLLIKHDIVSRIIGQWHSTSTGETMILAIIDQVIIESQNHTVECNPLAKVGALS